MKKIDALATPSLFLGKGPGDGESRCSLRYFHPYQRGGELIRDCLENKISSCHPHLASPLKGEEYVVAASPDFHRFPGECELMSNYLEIRLLCYRFPPP